MIPGTEYTNLYKQTGDNFDIVSTQVFDGHHPCKEGKGECCLAEVFPTVVSGENIGYDVSKISCPVF